MTSILVVYEQIDNTVEVNLAAIDTIFNFEGFSVRYALSRDVTDMELNWCDVCYAIRPSSIYSVNIARAITESNRLYISLFDDDLLNLPSSHPSCWRKKYMLKCLQQSKAVVMCNPLLIEDYKKIISSPLYILSHAFVREEEIKNFVDRKDKMTIIYPAGKDHTELFERYVMPAMNKLMKNHQNLEVHIMGIDPDLRCSPYQNRVIRHAARPLKDYIQFMREHDFCIGVAPLNNDNFSNRKYFIKYIDYARFGIAGIYSSCMPYTQVVKHGENGLLVENTIDSWEWAINSLIENDYLRKAIVENSQKDIRLNFSLESVRNKLFDDLQPLFENKPMKKNLCLKYNFISSFIFDQISNYHRLKAHIDAEGVVKTLDKIIMKA